MSTFATHMLVGLFVFTTLIVMTLAIASMLAILYNGNEYVKFRVPCDVHSTESTLFLLYTRYSRMKAAL